MTCASIYRISSINNHPPPCETCERHGDSYPPMPFFAPARPQVKFAFLPSEWHGDSYLHDEPSFHGDDKFCGLLIVVLIVWDCMG